MHSFLLLLENCQSLFSCESCWSFNCERLAAAGSGCVCGLFWRSRKSQRGQAGQAAVQPFAVHTIPYQGIVPGIGQLIIGSIGVDRTVYRTACAGQRKSELVHDQLARICTPAGITGAAGGADVGPGSKFTLTSTPLL